MIVIHTYCKMFFRKEEKGVGLCGLASTVSILIKHTNDNDKYVHTEARKPVRQFQMRVYSANA